MLLEIGSRHPFKCWCYDDRDRREQRLISCLFSWPKFSGCDPIFWVSRIRIDIGLAPASINLSSPPKRLVSGFILSRLIEPPWILLSSSLDGERKGGEDGGRAPAAPECPLWYVSHRDDPVMIHQSSWRGSAAGGNNLVTHFAWSRWFGFESPIF